MLKHLFISQYALIDTLDLSLNNGLSVITGETGAGKSIIMGALNLVMGARADSKSIRTGATKCVVEATFSLPQTPFLETIFNDIDLDFQPETIVRREFNTAGKSRAFVNDTPVSLQHLKQLALLFIDVHSQHENLLLNNSIFQLNIVDKVAKTDKLLEEYKSIFAQYSNKKQQLESLKQTAEQWSSERDYAQFQHDQLSEAQLEAQEQELLEQELDTLNHAEDIKTDLSTVVGKIDDEQFGAIVSIKESLNALNRSSKYMPNIEELADRLNSLYIDAKDISSEISTLFSQMDYDPARKLWVEERLGLIYSLQQKHRASSTAELIDIMNNFAQKLERIDSFDEEIELLTAELQTLHSGLKTKADALTDIRKSVLTQIADYLVEKLIYLGMPNSQLVVDLQPLNSFGANGQDEIQFLFSANKNMPLRPISNVASGGEISRVMLTLKSLIATSSQLSTIVFDEIDTGVSGEIAHRMGSVMRQMSENMQIITITHLPQIAALGENHYKVFKEDINDTTNSNIVPLSPNQRETEIAEMLSGSNPSETAILNARELMTGAK